MFTKIMTVAALLMILIYTKVVWSAIDVYNVYDNNGRARQVIILRSTTNPYSNGTFNTVITPRYNGE